MNLFPMVKSYFVYSDNTIKSDIMIHENCITYKDEETATPGIFKKTIAAMSFCKKNISYDYILRTNLSSFIHIPRLLDYLSSQPKELFVGAHFNQVPVNLEHPSKTQQIVKQSKINTYFKKILNEKFIYLHGAFFILSSDVIVKLLNEIKENYDDIQIPLSLPDDIAISMILYNFLSFDDNVDSAKFYHPKEFVNLFPYKYVCASLEKPDSYNNETIFHIRNKQKDEYINNDLEERGVDVMNYIFQIRYYYNILDFMGYIDEAPTKDEALINNVDNNVLNIDEGSDGDVIPVIDFQISEDVPVDSPDVPIDSPDVPIDSPDVLIDSPDVPIDSPDVPIDSPDVPIDSPDVPIDSPDVPIDSPDVPVDSPDVPVDSPEHESILV